MEEEELDMEIGVMNETQAQMYRENIPLATWVARRYCRTSVPSLDDRIQAARIGLWRAILHYDPTKAKLTTYAVQAMIHAIRRVARKESKPTGDIQITTDTRRRHEHTLPISSTDNGIVGVLRVDDLTATLATPDPSPEDNLSYQKECALLYAAAGRVPRLRGRKESTWTASDVMDMIVEGMTQAEIGRKLGVSRERIRQVVAAIRAERAKEGEV